MPFFQAIVLGLLQGITEFIPVSSSGHLVVIPWVLGWDDPGLTYDTILHLGTLVAVVLYFRRDILELLSAWWQSLRQRKLETPHARLAWLIVVSAIPAALLGFFLNDFFEQLFGSPRAASLLLLVTGGLLLASERLGRRNKALGSLSFVDALLVGLAQGCAIAPGISRSGATISVGLLRGLNREEAARFSFLIAIPIIAGAAGLQLLKATSAGFVSSGGLALVVGFVTASVSGYVAIRFLLKHVRAHDLRPFAYYCWAIGLIGLILTFVR